MTVESPALLADDNASQRLEKHLEHLGSGSENEWVVAGGGMLGLATAWRLAKAGHKVTLLEAADSIGGLTGAWSLGDVEWDKFYHVILLSDSRLRALLKEIGLDEEIR